MSAILLSEKSYSRLKYDLDKPIDDDAPQPDIPAPAPNHQFVRVTGEQAGGSGDDSFSTDLKYYPGQVEVWDAPSEEPVVLADVWVHEFNDYPLLNDAVYLCRQSGNFSIDSDESPDGDERALFVCALDLPTDGGDYSITCNGDTITVTKI